MAGKLGYKGLRYRKWTETGKAICKVHGEHDNFYYSSVGRFLDCKICRTIRQKKNYEDNKLKHLIKFAKRRAKDNNLDFNINEEYLTELLNKQQNKCAISNFVFENSGPLGVSIDKIDPNKGYTKDNIHLICCIINRMKTDIKLEDFKLYCKAVANES